MLAETLGSKEIEAMQRDGWRFSDSGVRVANGWLVTAMDPNGNYVPQLLADPDLEPEKWPETEETPDDTQQLNLF